MRYTFNYVTLQVSQHTGINLYNLRLDFRAAVTFR